MIEAIKTHFASFFTCKVYKDLQGKDMENAVRVSTWFHYPDGDCIALFIIEQHGKFVITDIGGTINNWEIRHLRSYDDDVGADAIVAQIERICANECVKYHEGCIRAECDTLEKAMDMVPSVIQACLRVGLIDTIS